MMTSFRSRWMDWQGSVTPVCSTDKTDRSFPATPETLLCVTDKTDKSPSVSFVSSTEEGLAQENEHVRCVVLLGQPAGEADSDDPAEGRNIVEAIQAAGGWIRIEDGNIALRWRGDMPEAGELIDRIRANRTGVVAALMAA